MQSEPTRVEIAEAIEHRKNHVQNLSRYRTETAKKYLEAMGRVASQREDSAMKTPIMRGDLVMREVLNSFTRHGTDHLFWDRQKQTHFN